MLSSFTKKFKKNKKGFTLIELIVVIAILGILAAIAVPRFSGMQDNAKNQADISTGKTIQSAVRIYEAQKGSLPAITGDDKLAAFNTAFKSVLPDGVPALQKSENHFYYNASTGEFVCNTSAPTEGTWITIK